jgi:alpha-beta hydrolase superfamily lysophospholipase
MSCVENWVQDVMDALEHLNEAGLPIFLLGHSLGGALALQAAPKAQRLLRGMIVAAPAMTVESVALPWKNYLLFPIGLLCVPKRPLIRLPVPSYEEMIKDHADEDLARRLLEDPYRVEKISARCGMVLNSVRSMPGANKAAAATSIPTLVICGTDDSALEGATQYFHSLSSTDKHLAVVPRQHHHLLRSCVENGVGDILSEWICGQLLEEREPQKA